MKTLVPLFIIRDDEEVFCGIFLHWQKCLCIWIQLRHESAIPERNQESILRDTTKQLQYH